VIKPSSGPAYNLQGITTPQIDADDLLDWKLNPDLPKPARPFEPEGLERSAASSFPNHISSSLWSGMYDVETFQAGGGQYAVVALVAGLKFFDLSSGTPFNHFNWPSDAGAWRLAMDGTTLYVVDYFENRVDIFDCSNPQSPNHQGAYVSPYAGRILNIEVENNILYMARDADGLEIVDVSNSSSPFYLSTYTGINNGQVKDVSIGGGYAFISLGNNPANEGEMQVVDVSNPSAPFNFTYTFRSDHVTQGVEHLSAGGFHSKDVVTVVNASNDPGAAGYDVIIDFYSWVAGSGLEYLNAITLNASGSSIWGETLFENQAYYALGSSGTAAIDITDITAATPTAPAFIGTPTGKFTATGTAVSPTDRSLLISETYGGLAQANLIDSGSPLSDLSRVEEVGRIYRTHRHGNLLFIANEHMGLAVYDVGDPYNPQERARYQTAGFVRDILVDWPLIYVAESLAGVSAIHYDVHSNTFNMQSSIPAPAGESVRFLAMKTEGSGAWQYLYASARTAGVMIIDISNDSAINQVGTIPASGSAGMISYLEDWDQLAVAEGANGVFVYDLATPTAPGSAFSIPPTLFQSNRVESDASGHLWVVDRNGQIDGYDISAGSPGWLGSYNAGWGAYRSIVPFETNALQAGGWGGMQILNWDDPAGVYEETWVRGAGFNMHNFPGTDFFVMSNLYELAIFGTPPDLLLDVQPAQDIWVPIGVQQQFSINGQTGSSWWWVDTHSVDGRTIATIDASGLLSGIAGGITRVYGYDDSGRWGISGQVQVQGGNTLVDHTVDYEVANINDTNTFMTIQAGTFNEPVEIEIIDLNVAADIPSPPSGYEALSAYDIISTRSWSGGPLTSGDFNTPVNFYAVYNQGLMPGGVPESAVGLWRHNNGTFQWDPVTILSVNENDNYVIADLQGFSTYAVFAPTSTVNTPAIISPADGDWINFREDIELSWNTVGGAIDYEVEVATDPAFGPVDIYIAGNFNTPPAFLTIGTNDGPEGSYYWRVRASDGATWSPWSTSASFILDESAPQVDVAQFSWGDIALHTDFTLSAIAWDNFQLDVVRLWFRSTGEASWQTLVMNDLGGNNYTGTIPGSFISWDGFQYLVVARDAAGNNAVMTADGPPDPGKYGQLALRYESLPDSPTISPHRWQMISLPHFPDEKRPEHLLANIGGIDNTIWRFFRWSGSGYREETSWEMETGRAYWLYHRQNDVHFEVGTGSTVLSGESRHVSLEAGWNDIGSPWLFAVPWDSVLTASGLTGGDLVGTYKYQGNSWALPAGNDIVPAWGGVSVYNRTGTTIGIEIPPIGSGGTAAALARGSRTTPVVLDGWQLQLLLSQEGAAGTDEQNFLGVRSDALADWDPADFPDPPIGLDGTARLSIDHSTRESDAGGYATDFVDDIADGNAWPLVVESIEGNRKTTLNIRGLRTLPDGFKAVLVDVSRNLRIDLDERVPYRFFPSETTEAGSGILARHSLLLLVGTPAWLDGQTIGIERLPVSVELHPNYPNPFNPSTTIRFSLREAGRVRLEVRNVRGQLVKVLANDRFNAGQHTLSWDGTDDSGRQVASGIYLTYFQAGEQVRTRKMTLIR